MSTKPAFWTRNELESILKAIDPSVLPVFMLLADTGMRLGEALRLEWQDVALDGREIRVSQTKSNTVRHVPMTARLQQTLSSLRNSTDPAFASVAESLELVLESSNSPCKLRRELDLSLSKLNLKGDVNWFRNSYIVAQL